MYFLMFVWVLIGRINIHWQISKGEVYKWFICRFLQTAEMLKPSTPSSSHDSSSGSEETNDYYPRVGRYFFSTPIGVNSLDTFNIRINFMKKEIIFYGWCKQCFDILRTEDQRYLNQIFWKCLFSRVFVLTVFVQNKCTRDHFSRETHKAMLSTFSKMLDTSKLKLKGMNLIHCILQYVHCVYNTCLPLFDRRCLYNSRKYVQPVLLKFMDSL